MGCTHNCETCKENCSSKGENTIKKEQLNAMSICCDAIMTLGKRYEAFAREEAEKCSLHL